VGVRVPPPAHSAADFRILREQRRRFNECAGMSCSLLFHLQGKSQVLFCTRNNDTISAYMNITQERIDDLNAVLKVSITPDDYKKSVDDALKKYSKKVNMPGFRPGMVPLNLVRKMYGKAVLADELNRLVADSVDKYITENKIEILGNPLPKAENDIDMNWEQPENFEFAFDMGLAPQFQLTIPPAHQFDFYEIEVSDNDINSEIDRLQRRHGDYINPEVSDYECSLYGTFAELDEQGDVLEGGISHQSFMLLDKVKDSEVRVSLTGLKAGDTVIFNPYTAMQNKEEVKYLLGLKPDDEREFNKPFRFTVERINKVTKAELNPEFFAKVYGEEVKDEAAFRERIKGEIAQGYRYESEHKLKHDIEDYFINELNINLPDEFLKRWIKHSNAKITDDQLSKEYNQYSRDLKWKMVENRIFREQDMKIEKEDLENYARHYIMDQYVRYGQAHLITDEKLEEMTQKFLSNQENIQPVVENITSRKVFEYLNQVISKKTQVKTYDDFMQILKEHVH
jgi:trigger factor